MLFLVGFALLSTLVSAFPIRPPPIKSSFVVACRSSTNGAPADTSTCTSAGTGTGTAEQLLHRLALDLDRLTEIRPPVPAADYSAPVTIISAGSSYTRLWTAETWKSHSRQPLARYARHVLTWPASMTARRILPTVVLSMLWAYLLSTASHAVRPLRELLDVAGPTSALSYLSAPLALLLTLRANASMSRLVEARLLWGRLLLHVRSLAGIINTYILHNNNNDRPRHDAIWIARHLAALGWTLKASVRGESPERENEVLRTMLGPDTSKEFQWVTAQPKRTVAHLTRIRQLAAAAAMTTSTSTSSSPLRDSPLQAAILMLMEQRIAELESCVGGCDRLFTSPIPPTYSRHLSRVMFLWLLLLPMSLAVMNLSTLGVMLPTGVATYVLVGIDEVGMEIENAFQLLPLQQLAAGIQNGVRDQIVPTSGPMPDLEDLF